MNLSKLHEKLIRAARANAPSDRVPYAFEQRILARLKDSPVLDSAAWWARALWRSAIACIGIALLFGAWTLLTPKPGAPVGDLSQDLENTLLAAADQDQSIDSTW